MKSVAKMLVSASLLLTLVSCGGEDEIVYEPSPYDIPTVYTLDSGDTAPAYYSNMMTYAQENATVTSLNEEGEEGEDGGASAENLSADGEDAEEVDEDNLSKEEKKALAEEEKRVAAAIALLQEERTRELAKLTSIRLVSLLDPTEMNAASIEEARLAYLEANGLSEESATDEEGVEDLTYMDDVAISPFFYTYDVSSTGKAGGQVTSDYVSHMQSSGFKIIDPFHPVNNEYYEMLTPDFTQRAGTVALAKKASGVEKIFMVIVDWHYTGAAVTVYEEEGTLWIAPVKSTGSQGSLSINDVVGFLETRRPSDLGLDGSSMAEYNVFTSEGIVMVNGVTYRKFIISGKGTGAYGGTYLVDAEGNTFVVDDVNNTVSPLKISNIYDTL